jgi:hypothetical protein
MEKTDEIRRARLLVSDARLIAFFHAPFEGSMPHALAIARDLLGKDDRIDTLFAERNGLEFDLSATQLGEDRFEIFFGCTAGPDAGDGGSWEVTFHGNDVLSVTEKMRWIS